MSLNSSYKDDQLKDDSDDTRADDSSSISSDPELQALAAYLKATAPICDIDLAFRESLHASLLNLFAEQQRDQAPEAEP